MESLALLVTVIYLAILALSLLTVTLAVIWRVKQKFQKSAIVALVLLSFIAIWATSVSLPLGAVPLIGVAVSALLLFIPRKISK